MYIWNFAVVCMWYDSDDGDDADVADGDADGSSERLQQFDTNVVSSAGHRRLV